MGSIGFIGFRLLKSRVEPSYSCAKGRDYHMLRLLGTKTLLYEAFGLFLC